MRAPLVSVRRTGILAVVCALALLLAACAGQATSAQTPASSQATSGAQAADDASSISEGDANTAHQATSGADYDSPGEAYTLKQVVVLSRHNIRAPLSSNGSALAIATPHQWIDWTAGGSELTLRGGSLETMNGQYYQRWLEHEGLIPHNWQPEAGQVRFYANAKQRTLATARCFSSGLLPAANVEIETRAEFDTMDPVFTPKFTFVSDAYCEAALKQIAEFGGAEGMRGVAAGLAESYQLISDVVDYTKSEGYASGEFKDLNTTDTNVVIELDKEPAMQGSLKTACSLSDALVLQYYEDPDAKDAAFGKDLSTEQWALISKAKDTYNKVLFTAPLVATNIAHPLLQEIGSELDTEGRLFTFLCGHDSNIASVLATLKARDYELPNSIETGTPIGVKLLFERWVDASGASYGRVRLTYQSTEQLRSGSMVSGYECPQTVELELDGLQKNADGLYAYDDLRARIQQATEAYDELVSQYGEQELAEAA